METYLGIYLRDQLALGVFWREVARRARGSNRGTPLGDALAEVADGITEDVDTFHTIMRRIGFPPNPVKTRLSVVAERIGRLKLTACLRQSAEIETPRSAVGTRRRFRRHRRALWVSPPLHGRTVGVSGLNLRRPSLRTPHHYDRS